MLGLPTCAPMSGLIRGPNLLWFWIFDHKVTRRVLFESFVSSTRLRSSPLGVLKKLQCEFAKQLKANGVIFVNGRVAELIRRAVPKPPPRLPPCHVPRYEVRLVDVRETIFARRRHRDWRRHAQRRHAAPGRPRRA